MSVLETLKDNDLLISTNPHYRYVLLVIKIVGNHLITMNCEKGTVYTLRSDYYRDWSSKKTWANWKIIRG